MKTLTALEPLTTKLLEITRINSAASVLSWDQETHMPAGGGAARAEQIAVLQGLAHDKLVSPDIERLLAANVDPALASSVFITTLTDVFGFFSFLGLATVFMRFLAPGSL